MLNLPRCVVPLLSENLSHRLTCFRMFWPKEIWGLHGEALADFKDTSNASQAVQCLNHMVTDALRLAPHCTFCWVMIRIPANIACRLQLHHATVHTTVPSCCLLLCFCVPHESTPVHRCSFHWNTSPILEVT